jgi:hypothetical protein
VPPVGAVSFLYTVIRTDKNHSDLLAYAKMPRASQRLSVKTLFELDEVRLFSTLGLAE